MEGDIFNHIAVIGMSGRFPQANSIDQLWENLLAGKNCIEYFTDEELLENGLLVDEIGSEKYIKAKGNIEGANIFDANFFGYSAKEALILDPQGRIFLEEAWKALEDSGNMPSNFKGDIGVYAGTGMNTYLLWAIQQNSLNNYDEFDIMIGSDKDLLSTRLSYKFNLTGPSITIQTTCSTSLVAVHLACQGLLSGDCDMAIAGGVSISYPLKQGYKYRNGMIYSKTGKCSPFDTNADGTVFSDGVGVVVLKRLEDAINDRDSIYAVIKASAVNNDGSNKAGFTAPSAIGQAKAIRDCISLAEIPVETIQYLEAHGTGTEIGDPLEFKAVSQVYREETEKKNFCAIGSLKSNLGHLNTAAGIAGLIKAILILKNKLIPPMANFSEPHESLEIYNSPFYINTDVKPLREDIPSRVAVSSFGIGGTNAHLILEEAPKIESVTATNQTNIFTFSAKSQKSLLGYADKFTKWISKIDDLSLSDLSRTLVFGREQFDYRIACTAKDKEELTEKVKNFNKSIKAEQNFKKPIYFLITGQGSQYVNMAKDLYNNVDMIKQIVDEAANYIKKKYDKDILSILYPDKEDQSTKGLIDNTEYAQLILFTVSYALGSYLISIGIKPDKLIGHSLGEYVAACLAGVMSFEDGLDIVCKRGELIQSAERGKMLAVKISKEELEELKLENVSIAAINSPKLLVLSGTFEAIGEVEKVLKEENIFYQPLKVSHAFHSYMMEEVAKEFEEYLGKYNLKSPNLCIISNLTGREIKEGELIQEKYWRDHMVNPVVFSEGISNLLNSDEAVFIEIGAGSTLINLSKEHEYIKEHLFIDMLPNRYYKKCQYTFFIEKILKLWEVGVNIDFEKILACKYNKLNIPTYVFDGQEYSLLSNEPLIVNGNTSGEGKKIPINRDNIGSEYVEPRDEVEELLLNLLRENTGTSNIGVMDNFFELGLDSLSASQYSLIIKESIDVDIPVGSIIEAGNVANLAKLVIDDLLLATEA